MTARTEHGLFVSAVRHLLAAGWTHGFYDGHTDHIIAWDLQSADGEYSLHWGPSGEMTLTGPDDCSLIADVTSVQQAVAYLRIAGVLPTAEVLSSTPLWRCPKCHTSYIRPYHEHREGCPPLEPVTTTITRRAVTP